MKRPRPFLRPAVDAAMPEVRRMMAAEVSAMFGVPAELIHEDDRPPFKALAELDEEFMLADTAAFVRRMRLRLEAQMAPLRAAMADGLSLSVIAPSHVAVQHAAPALIEAAGGCSTCHRLSDLHTWVPACASAPPGGCKQALRRCE